jgi:DNA replication protein DnaC
VPEAEASWTCNREALAELVASEDACANCPGPDLCMAPVKHAITRGGYCGTGLVEIARQVCEPARVASVRQADANRLSGILKSSGLPDGTAHMTLDTYKPGIGTEQAQRLALIVGSWAVQPGGGKGLLFAGPTGVGKTHLTAGILRRWAANGRRCLFSTVPELLADLWVCRNDSGLQEAVMRLGRVEALFLDDLGAERKGSSWDREWAGEQVFKILNRRDLEKPALTVASTNYGTREQLVERFGERTVSRLLGLCEWCPVDGPDYRVERGGQAR